MMYINNIGLKLYKLRIIDALFSKNLYIQGQNLKL